MSDHEEEYEVQKILNKRTVNGQVQYYLKWKHYSALHNSWEREGHLNCPDLVSKFEKSRIDFILGKGFHFFERLKYIAFFHFSFHENSLYCDIFLLGATRKANGEITYLMKLKNVDTLEEQESTKVKEILPDLLINFLQSRLRWTSLLPSSNEIMETEEPAGAPLRIICM